MTRWLKGQTGDAIHAVLCAAGYNIHWLLRAMGRLGLKGLFASRVLVWLRLVLAQALGVRKSPAL
jgi:IS5 family transposase